MFLSSKVTSLSPGFEIFRGYQKIVLQKSGDIIAGYKVFSGKLDLDPRLMFAPSAWPGLRGHVFKVLQGVFAE